MEKDPLSPGAHEIVVDGIRQRYHVAGHGPVCLVHPGGPGVHWEYLRMPLVEEGVTTVYVAPVGAGESDDMPYGDYRISTYVRFLDALVDHLAVPELYFMGHSHGAMVGLQYGMDHPGKIAGLLEYAGAPVHGPDLAAEMAVQIGKFAERHAGHPKLADVMKAQEEGFLGSMDKAEIVSYMDGILPLYFRDFWSLEEELKPWLAEVDFESAPATYPHDWDVRGKLGKVGVPTLLMAGRYDFICPVRWAREMHKEIPRSQVTVFEESGHFAHIEQRKEFARAVFGFLS